MSVREPMAETVDQLRDDIDRGLAADKVAVVDPAAAPLGTDDEAAGRPASRRRIGLAWRNEVADRQVSEGGDNGVAIYLLAIAAWCATFLVAVLAF